MDEYREMLDKVQNDPYLIERNSLTCNRFAYLADNYQLNPTSENLSRRNRDLKTHNFVPIYDNWCLYCDNKTATKRCSCCRLVYFCNVECQRRAWPIHKKHCGRDCFTICSFCGKEQASLKCPHCPVKFCSSTCKDKIYQAHLDYDCSNFRTRFLS